MSQYLEALRQAMVIYPIIVVLFTVPYIAWSYHKIWISPQFTGADCVQLYSVPSLRLLPCHSTVAYAGKGRHTARAQDAAYPVFFSRRYSQASRDPAGTACQLAAYFHRQCLLDNRV